MGNPVAQSSTIHRPGFFWVHCVESKSSNTFILYVSLTKMFVFLSAPNTKICFLFRALPTSEYAFVSTPNYHQGMPQRANNFVVSVSYLQLFVSATFLSTSILISTFFRDKRATSRYCVSSPHLQLFPWPPMQALRIQF